MILIRHGQTEFIRTHWGFIRTLTGLKVPNGAVLRIDPTRPDGEPELLFVPETG